MSFWNENPLVPKRNKKTADRLDFLIELRKWRDGRPEFAKLVKAIKSGVPGEKLYPLADAAGVDGNELVELRTMRARAVQAKETLKDAARVEAMAAEFVRRCDEADKALKKCKPHELQECQRALLAAESARVEYHRTDVARINMAKRTLEAAKEKGLA